MLTLFSSILYLHSILLHTPLFSFNLIFPFTPSSSHLLIPSPSYPFTCEPTTFYPKNSSYTLISIPPHFILLFHTPSYMVTFPPTASHFILFLHISLHSILLHYTSFYCFNTTILRSDLFIFWTNVVNRSIIYNKFQSWTHGVFGSFLSNRYILTNFSLLCKLCWDIHGL